MKQDFLISSIKRRKQLTKKFKLRLIEYGKFKKALLEHIHRGHLKNGLSKRRIINFEQAI